MSTIPEQIARSLSPAMCVGLTRALNDDTGIWTGREGAGLNVTLGTVRALRKRGLLVPKGNWVKLSEQGHLVAQLIVRGKA